LDIAAGSAYFSIEVANQHPHITVVAIDLFPGSVSHAKEHVAATNLVERLAVLIMDASNLGFPDS
jgi:ubiquinone/menaquinone biosynthesis C-methylase UbiE